MENGTMTVRDAIIATMNLLGNIPVPRNLNQSIGIPIDNAIGNLQACIEAMDRAKENDENGNTDTE